MRPNDHDKAILARIRMDYRTSQAQEQGVPRSPSSHISPRLDQAIVETAECMAAPLKNGTQRLIEWIFRGK